MMNAENKQISGVAKDAMKRMKSGFWDNTFNDLNSKVEEASKEGRNISKVIKYYSKKAEKAVYGANKEEEEFYLKVKYLLDTEGEVSDAIKRLIDYSIYDDLNYEGKQRYTLALSEKYRIAVARYNKDSEFEKKFIIK